MGGQLANFVWYWLAAGVAASVAVAGQNDDLVHLPGYSQRRQQVAVVLGNAAACAVGIGHQGKDALRHGVGWQLWANPGGALLLYTATGVGFFRSRKRYCLSVSASCGFDLIE